MENKTTLARKEETPVMTGKRTLTMIKPNAVKNGHMGSILEHITSKGFRIVALKMIQMSRRDARLFYGEHHGKPFFHNLVEFMVSGPIVVAVLEKENCVSDFRDTIGATDPKKAAEGTIRAKYGTSIGENAIHASDSDISAQREMSFHFSGREIYPINEKG